MAYLKQRRREPEQMDDPTLGPDAYAHALHGLSRINFVTGAAQVFWRHLRPVVHTCPTRKWRLLDVGTGGGDVPLRIWKLARSEGFAVQIAGSDMSERAAALARARAAAASADVRFFRHDAVSENFPGDYDFVISSLMLHHLSSGEAVTLLRKLKLITRRLLLVSDLRRCPLGLGLAFIGTHMLTRSSVTQADGLRSVRAAYTVPEICALAADAGLDRAKVIRHWPARWLIHWSPE